MSVNRFVLNGTSYHGHGAINEIPGIVASKGFKKAFVASDPDLVKFGVTAKITELLEKNGIAYELYTDIKQPQHERSVEKVLASNGIPWNKTEVWIEDERLYEVRYATVIDYDSTADEEKEENPNEEQGQVQP